VFFGSVPDEVCSFDLPLRRIALRQSPKPPTTRINSWGMGNLAAKSRLLTSAQFRGMRRQPSDLDAKLRQMTAAEHEPRRSP
jgi:hypothetical protein